MATTVLTSWALLVWQTLQDRGIDPRPVFKKAKLDASKLGDGNARYNVDNMWTLWDLAEKTTDDESIGLRIGDRWHVTTFHALGFAWLASDSFKEAISRFARYARLVNNAVHAQLDMEGPHYRFSYNITDQEHLSHPVANDAAQAAILKMCRGLLGRQFRPLEVRSERSACGKQVELETHFQCPYILGGDSNCWLLDRYDVERHLPTANPELAHANEVLALNYLTRVDKDDIVARVCKLMMEQLPSGTMSEKDVAASLNMSQRTLQRDLAKEKHSFSSLLNETRQELAQLYIRNSAISLNEISYLLGFSEPASFTRAFKRWTGAAPSQYRRKVLSRDVSQLGSDQENLAV